MLLKELLQKLEQTKKEINTNIVELQRLEERHQILTQSNEKLEKEKEKLIKQINNKKLLKVNVYNVFTEIQEKLLNRSYEGRFCVSTVYCPLKADMKTFNLVKQNIINDNVSLNIYFQFVHFSGLRGRDFNLSCLVKDIELSNGKKLIDVLELKNNQVIIPKDCYDKIILNIDIADENMKSDIFYNAVMNDIEKGLGKN